MTNILGYFGSTRSPRDFPTSRNHVTIFPTPICRALWKHTYTETEARFLSFSIWKKSMNHEAESISSSLTLLLAQRLVRGWPPPPLLLSPLVAHGRRIALVVHLSVAGKRASPDSSDASLVNRDRATAAARSTSRSSTSTAASFS